VLDTNKGGPHLDLDKHRDSARDRTLDACVKAREEDRQQQEDQARAGPGGRPRSVSVGARH
jgi:hypothetical protein